MKRVLGHCLAGLGVIAGAVGVMSACTHNDSSFFVQNVLYPTPVSAGQACIFTADPNQTHISSGTLDVGFGRFEYSAEFLVANQLVPESNQAQLQTETANINIEGAVVRVTDAAGNQLSTFTSLTSGTVYASTGTIPGYASVGLTILDAKTTSSLSGPQTLVTYTKFFGKTLGGNYIESNEFEFPIYVCTGCLVSYSATDISPNYAFPNCVGTGMGSSAASLPVPCTIGQDTSVDCAQCLDFAICRKNTPTGIADAGGGG